MEHTIPAYRIFPLGDTALTLEFGHTIDESLNRIVLALFDHFREDPLPGMLEVVPAYSSLTIYYSVRKLYEHREKNAAGLSVFEWMCKEITQRLKKPVPQKKAIDRYIEVPVCYDSAFAPDLELMAKQKNLSPKEIIDIHSSLRYRVYMLGFLPGFAYMGEVDERIAASRKSHPVTVQAGSIGIAGRQTGIYPFASPGGWQVIGRTPLVLFNAANDQPALLQAGDFIQFIPISKNEFESY